MKIGSQCGTRKEDFVLLILLVELRAKGTSSQCYKYLVREEFYGYGETFDSDVGADRLAKISESDARVLRHRYLALLSGTDDQHPSDEPRSRE